MTTMTHKTTRVAEAQGNLTSQFRGLPNIAAIIKAFAQQSQDVEDAAFGLLTDTTIDNAVGVQLDGSAALVGIERGGSDDDELRLRIQAQILVNKSSGTIPEILEILETLLVTSIVLTEVYPHKMEIVVNSTLANGATVAATISKAKGGGIGLDFTWFSGTNPFRFDTVGQGFDLGELAGHAHY